MSINRTLISTAPPSFPLVLLHVFIDLVSITAAALFKRHSKKKLILFYFQTTKTSSSLTSSLPLTIPHPITSLSPLSTSSPQGTQNLPYVDIFFKLHAAFHLLFLVQNLVLTCSFVSYAVQRLNLSERNW